MASIIKVDKLDPQSGTALEVGTSGDTVTVPSGVGLTLTDSTLLLPTTITSTTEVKTNKISPATGVAFTLGDSGDTFTIPSGATILNSGTATGFPETDLTPVNQDILTLALRQSIDNNSAKYNLPNSAITHFESDADYDSGGSTDIVRNAAEYIATGVEVSGAYSNDGNTVLLLHMDDTGLTDSSSNGVTITLNGGVARSAVESKFGGYSALFDASALGYLSTPDLDTVDGSVTTPTTGDFTIDSWFKQETRAGADRYWSFGNNGTPASGGQPALTCGYNAATTWNTFHSAGTNTNITFPTISSDWHHIAAMRSSGTLYWFYDGVRKGDFSMTYDMQASSGTAFVGVRSYTGTEYFDGYIDEFRYSNNARYSTSGTTGDQIFTPPADSTTTNATGTALGTTNVPTAAVTSVSGVMLIKNAYGTNTLGTDVIVYFTADNSNWTEAASYTSSGTFSTGITQIALGQTTVTSGSDVRWKIVFANQVSESKEAYIYGMGLNY